MNLLVAFNACLDLIKHAESYDLRRAEQVLGFEIPGKGQREVAVTREVLERLVSELGYEIERPGGIVGHACYEAPRLGVEVYAHLPKCRELLRFFGTGVRVASGGEFIPAPEIKRSCGVSKHYIIEVAEGDRFIATYDEEAFRLEVDKEFVEVASSRIKEMHALIVSGFHLVSGEHAGRILAVKKILEEWKEENPELFVHLELGDFQDEKALRETTKLAEIVSCIGGNEQELMRFAGAESLSEISLPAPVLLHESHYSAVISEEPKKYRHSLWFATLCNAFRAIHGRFPTAKELGVFTPPGISREGIERLREIRKILPAEGVPALYHARPKLRVGMGDCFVVAFAISQLWF